MVAQLLVDNLQARVLPEAEILTAVVALEEVRMRRARHWGFEW
jgi:hypothetical protein